jgi:hypothetical protein
MTDERRPDEPETSDQGTPAEEQATEPPPPLAPLVGQGGQAADDASADESDTTAQPTSSWTQPASTSTPPPIPPPAMPTPAMAAPSPQPAVSWAPAPAPVAATGKRTTLSLAAGILLILGGILGGLAGLAVAVFGNAIVRSLEDFGGMPEIEGMNVAEFMTGFIVFFGIIILVYSLVYLFAGIGVVRSRDWGRVLGLIVGTLSGLLWLASVASPDQPNARDSIVGSLIAFGIHAYIVVALLFFWRAKPSTA